MNPLLTIAIVSFSADEELKRTLESITDAKNESRVEVLVQLAKNDPALVHTAKSFWPHASNLTVLNPGDNGIYDGMNRLRTAATGEYLWYLNAGDELHGGMYIIKLLSHLKDPICYGFQSAQVFDGDVYVRPGAGTVQPQYFEIGHQSALFHRNAYTSVSFNEALPVSADVDFNRDCFAATGMQYIPEILSTFELGGVSNRALASDANKFKQESLELRLKQMIKVLLRALIGQKYLYRLLFSRKYDRLSRQQFFEKYLS